MASAGPGSLQHRTTALREAQPGFSETLALAKEVENARPPAPDQQLAVCRALARSLPASLPPSDVAALTALGLGWLAPAASGSTAAAALQLQAEAAHLLLALLGTAKTKLAPQSSRQLLQQLCRLCQQRAQPGSVAAQELACGCMDLLAQLPQWYPQPPKPELAAAVAAVAAVLDQQLASGIAREETAAATRLLCKLLRALQLLLAEAKKDHGANAATLATALQRLLMYGWQQRGAGAGSGASTPRRGSSLSGAAPFSAALATAALPASPSKYRPPHARASTQDEPPAGASDGGARLSLESSDSESSDAESSGGGGDRSSRVRAGALACLQLLAKADPKSLHASWTTLLPTSDVAASRCGRAGGGASVAHLLLHDPRMRVRHAAAATLATLLEGPAQRTYLAVAEARDLERQPVRGFITLSATLGQMVVALHQALLASVAQERDPAVLAAALRALGTLLLGAPYHRLPPRLLPLCVQALIGCLAKATPPAGVASLAPQQLPVATACLSCLAAAFSCKAAGVPLAGQLLLGGSSSGSDGSSERQQEQLLQLLLAYAACQQPALQLEALLALRGLAQQHAALLQGQWDRLLALGRAGVALPAPAVPQSPRAPAGAADGTLPEKVAQQSVRLPGDYLEGAVERLGAGAAPAALAAAAAQAAQQWQQVAEQVLGLAVQHSSSLLRAAAHAVVGGLSPAAFAALAPPLQQQLLAWCCQATAADEASPVRAAAVKAVGAVAAAPALLAVPKGLAQALGALASGCQDSVLAVRIPAAATLAALCRMAAGAEPAAAAQPVVPTCLRLAVAAATDSDKLRPSALQALGSLYALAGRLPAAAASEQQELFAAAAGAVQDCLASSNARAQWAACEAASDLLACPAEPVQRHAPAVLQQLLALLRQCPNFRSRALAAAALQRLRTLPALAVAEGQPQLLEAVAAVLFQGKASDFNVAPPAGAATAAGQGGPPPRQEPAELGSRALLEAALVAATLHLLALLPGASGGGHQEQRMAGCSTHLPHLRLLVQQAQRELLLPPGQAGPGMAAAAGGAAGEALLFFDLSQVSPALAAAALEGLALLEA